MVLKRNPREKQAGVLKKLKAEKNHDVLDDKGDIKRPNRRGVPEKVARWMSLNAKYVTNRLANHVMVDGQNLQETITSVIESLPNGKKIGSKQSEKIILQFSKAAQAEDTQPTPGEDKKTIHSKKGYIEGICSAARLEMYFLDAAADIITDVVHDNVLNCLPTSTLKEHPSLDKSIVKLSELQRSQLVRRSTSVLESELVSIKTLLLNMQRGMSPTVDGTVSEFYKTVVDRCSNFFNNTLWEPAEKGPSERPYLSGKAAKTNYFEHLAAKTAEDHGSVTAHDIELLRPYW
jgi:hypothetical protein